MKCPVCKTTQHKEIDLHSDGFYQDIYECNSCSAVWSVQHGIAGLLKDPQKNSFLEAANEYVEGVDHN